MSFPDYSTQLPGRRQVVELTHEDIKWTHGEDPTVCAKKYFGNKRSHSDKVFAPPAYGCDFNQVSELLELCHEKAPLCNPVTVNIMHLIDRRQLNGFARQEWDYYNCFTPEDCQCTVPDGRRRNWDGVIALSGRGTEIHPAIARYVVAHEYGHIVEDALGLIRHGEADAPNAGGLLIKEWAKFRRIPQEALSLDWRAKTHHLMATEVFANDFRFMLGLETEWWPHKEVVPALGARGTKRAQTWWVDVLDQLQDCYRDARKAETT